MKKNNLLFILIMLQLFIPFSCIVPTQKTEDNYYDGVIYLISLSPPHLAKLVAGDTVSAILSYIIDKIETKDTTYEIWLGFRKKDANPVINDYYDWKYYPSTYRKMKGLSGICTLSVSTIKVLTDTTIVWPLNVNIIMTTNYDCSNFCSKIVSRIEDISYLR